MNLKLCLLFAIMLVGCPKPIPEPTPLPDADAAPPPLSDGAPVPSGGVLGACTQLLTLGCPEAKNGVQECATSLQEAIDSKVSKKITAANVSCVAGSTSIELVRACPGGWCPLVGY